MRCTLVSPFFRKIGRVKFEQEDERPLFLISYEWCQNEATVIETDGQFTFHHCETHAGHGKALRRV